MEKCPAPNPAKDEPARELCEAGGVQGYGRESGGHLQGHGGVCNYNVDVV